MPVQEIYLEPWGEIAEGDDKTFEKELRREADFETWKVECMMPDHDEAVPDQDDVDGSP